MWREDYDIGICGCGEEMYSCIQFSHQRMFSIYSYTKNCIIQSTTLFNIKQVEVKEELDFKVVFYDNRTMLLAFQNSQRYIYI